MKRLSLIKPLVPLALLLLLCGSTRAAVAAAPSLAYHWPIKPFDQQHPVRGAFGDPRTIDINQPFGVTQPGDSGGYSFHNGVDIAAAPGTPVYPVVSGRVVCADAGLIVVRSAHKRVFQYVHLLGNVKLGQQVVAERTVLGWIQAPFDHVHLAEIDGYHVQNPLAVGHLEPYADHTTPHAIALRIREGSLAIEAVDEQAMPVPGPFAGLPQTPALVEWRLCSGDAWSSWHVVADVRQTIPTRKHFWEVYAAGTYQNAPVFDGRLYRGIAGRYLFLTGLDLSRMAPGAYKLEARVADIRGNSTTTTWVLQDFRQYRTTWLLHDFRLYLMSG
jgi:hypothetical protein